MDCIHLALGRVQKGAFEQGSELYSTGTGRTSVEVSLSTIMNFFFIFINIQLAPLHSNTTCF